MGVWVCDDSGALKSTENEVWIEEKAKQSTKFNALWKDGEGLSVQNANAQFFEMKIESGERGVWFGLTDEQSFGSGWKCKGFNFGGNLSDGGALMRSEFGPWPKVGDVVAMRAEIVEGKKLQIYFAVNGIGLGKAFDIDLEGTSIGPLFPVVSFSTGPGKVSISQADPAPPVDTMKRQGGQVRTSIDQGKWAVTASQLVTDGENLPPVELAFIREGEHLSLSAHVANNLRVGLNPEAPHNALRGGVMATMMMPPPELVPLENAVSSILSSISSVSLGPDGKTVEIKTSGEKQLTVTASAFEKTASPVLKSEINWIK